MYCINEMVTCTRCCVSVKVWKSVPVVSARTREKNVLKSLKTEPCVSVELCFTCCVGVLEHHLLYSNSLGC